MNPSNVFQDSYGTSPAGLAGMHNNKPPAFILEIPYKAIEASCMIFVGILLLIAGVLIGNIVTLSSMPIPFACATEAPKAIQRAPIEVPDTTPIKTCLAPLNESPVM